MPEMMSDIYWEIGLEGSDWGLEQLFLSQISEEGYYLRKEKHDYFLIVPATFEFPARIADLELNFKATRPLLYTQQDEVMEKVERILKVLSSQLWCIDMRLGKLSVKHIGYWDHGKYLRRVSIVEEVRVLDHILVTTFDSFGQIKHRHPTELTQLRQEVKEQESLENLMVLIQDYGIETWVGLYKIFEYLSAAVGGKPGIKKRLGIHTQETQRFTHTANHPDASGLLSRHAVSREQAPKEPMTLAAGQQYIQHLVLAYRQYISSKISSE